MEASEMIASGQLRALEALVRESAKKLVSLGLDNKDLAAEISRLKDENRRLKEELRNSSATLGRHNRIKERLAKLSKKLEGIGL